MSDAKPSILSRIFAGSPGPAESVASGKAPASPAPGSVDLAALKAQARKARNKPTGAEIALKDAEQQALLDELFENENWEVMAEMYFEIRYAMTDFEYFRLTDKQRRVLGKSMGTCMRLLLNIDPRYVALIVFFTNAGAYAADKELAYRRAWKLAEQRAAEQRGAGQNGGRA